MVTLVPTAEGANNLSTVVVMASAAATAASQPQGQILTDGATIRVLVGDTLLIAAATWDPNPTDSVRLRLEAPSDYRTQPTSLTIAGDGSGRALAVQWAPGPADGGKETLLCFVIDGTIDDPCLPSLSRPQPALRLCVTVVVPPCLCRAGTGDTLRAIALRYGVPWRTIFALNPGLPGPDALLQGSEVAVGRMYTLRASEMVEDLPELFGVGWTTIATHNAPALLRLSAPSPVSCDPEGRVCFQSDASLAAAGGRVPAGQLVVDVNFTDLAQTETYGSGAGTNFCIVGRAHSGCL